LRQDTLGECLVQANAVVVPGMARKYALETACVAGLGSSSASRAGTTLGYMGGVLPQRRGTLDLPGWTGHVGCVGAEPRERCEPDGSGTRGPHPDRIAAGIRVGQTQIRVDAPTRSPGRRVGGLRRGPTAPQTGVGM